MSLSRREFTVMLCGAGAATLLGAGPTQASVESMEAALADFLQGAQPVEDGRLELTLPEIAENGNTVPIDIYVDSPMSAEDHVRSVVILADGNPNPGVGAFHFSSLSGEASASTRIRLSQTQNVVAAAKMSDGSVTMSRATVKVTIGGCGG